MRGMRSNPFAGFGDSGAGPAMVPPGYPGMPGSPASAIPPMSYGPQGGLAPAIQSSLEGILDPQLDGSDYFFYACNIGSLAPSATLQAQIQIDAGTDFLWIATTYQSNVSATAATSISGQIAPLISLLITDTGATKNLMNSPVPINTIAGQGEFPYRLIEPRLFRANSTINFTFSNYAGGGGDTYTSTYWVMHGIRKIAGTFNLG